jgi:hypothetical protein
MFGATPFGHLQYHEIAGSKMDCAIGFVTALAVDGSLASATAQTETRV